MSCPVPKKSTAARPPVDVLAYVVHPLAHGAEAERLADALDAESRALALTRQALVTATRERDEARGRLDALRARAERAESEEAERDDALRALETAAREVLRVVGTPTTLEQQKAHLGELRAALTGLRAALPVREGEEVRHG